MPVLELDLCPEPPSCVAEISLSDVVLNAGDPKGRKTQSLSPRSSARGQTQRQINWTWPKRVVIEENMVGGGGGQLSRGPWKAFQRRWAWKGERNWPNRMRWKVLWVWRTVSAKAWRLVQGEARSSGAQALGIEGGWAG